MSQFSHLATTLIGSEIVKLGNAISQRIEQGEKIYNYTIGDFNPLIFPIPQELEDLIVDAYRNHHTNYPAADGILELRMAVSDFIKLREDLDYGVNEIQIASGGRPLIYTLFKTIVDEKDKVIYAVPSWNNNHYTHLTGGEHCEIQCHVENDFMPTANDIRKNIKGASLICLCTPQNPTGTTLCKDVLEEICALIIEENACRGENEKKLYLMFDQMYWTLTYGDTKHFNPVTLIPEMKYYTIFIDGISKAFCATGVRVGWAMGPASVIAKMKSFLSHIGAWAPMAEQKAVASYLPMNNAIDTFLFNYKAEIEFRLVKLYQGFITLKSKGYPVEAISPKAAIYLTIKVELRGKKTIDGRELKTQEDTTSYLLSEAKLAVVPFAAFGGDAENPWYRISVGTCKKEEINEMFAMLEVALAKLS